MPYRLHRARGSSSTSINRHTRGKCAHRLLSYRVRTVDVSPIPAYGQYRRLPRRLKSVVDDHPGALAAALSAFDARH